MGMMTRIDQRAECFKAVDPQSTTGSAITGEIIDRQGFSDGYIFVNWAASTNTPTTALCAVTVEHGDDSGLSDTALYATLAAAENVKAKGSKEYSIDLAQAKRYIRVDLHITYTDGSSPANIIDAAAFLGGKGVNPPIAATTDTIFGR